MVKFLSLERIIRPAVFKFLAEAAADLNFVFWCDRDVAAVEVSDEKAHQFLKKYTGLEVSWKKIYSM